MAREHEITLVAFGQDGGRSVILDIVETSRHYASHFMRSFYRNADVLEVAAVWPGASVDLWPCYARKIYREQG